MKASLKIFLFSLLFGLFIGCNLEKEIEIEIPDFENGYVVESYLAPDRVFGLLITRSYGFYEVFDLADLEPGRQTDFLVQGVEGYIEVNENRYPLINQITIDPDSRTIYNYVLQQQIELSENDRITLALTFPTGEEVDAVTNIPESRPLDSVRINLDKSLDLEARETTFFYTDSTTTEYYRRQLFRIHEGKTEEMQDFLADNSIAKGGKMAFGSGYDFAIGDTLISRITHIDKEYHDFYLSAIGSVSSNESPFGQPGRIISNIRGSDRVIGIFTGINQSEILIEIKDN
ncbi:MAG TPA: hypothetical protein VKZ54_02285 [Membranihabitans sp.]|nr:hypothetical protein [Membranihabitans sp.]